MNLATIWEIAIKTANISTEIRAILEDNKVISTEIQENKVIRDTKEIREIRDIENFENK